LIIVRLNGGLGNQLFQYAAGKALAIKNNDVLKIDVTGYDQAANQKQIFRNLDIADFLISAPQASINEVLSLKYPLGPISKISKIINQKLFSRYYVDWHPELLQKKGGIYLDGYFQTEKYFVEHKEAIFKEFTLQPGLAQEIQSNIAEIEAKKTSISLHIRRGDYADDPKTSKLHLVCDISYYERAISYMLERFPGLHLFVFSDDPDWVREYVPISVPLTFVSTGKGDRNRFRPSQELVLMSKCQHHILSNSSFSWWGAYLNSSSGKVVLAPNVWNRGSSPQPSILPMDWIAFPVLRNGK